jgi:addiction module HigA family antidote
MKIIKTLPPMHPGEMLREEFLEPLGLTPYAVAKACGVPRTRIERIAREELGISADTALRLAKLFRTSAEFWLNLQTRYDMLTAERAIAKDLKRIEPLKREAA